MPVSESQALPSPRLGSLALFQPSLTGLGPLENFAVYFQYRLGPSREESLPEPSRSAVPTASGWRARPRGNSKAGPTRTDAAEDAPASRRLLVASTRAGGVFVPSPESIAGSAYNCTYVDHDRLASSQ